MGPLQGVRVLEFAGSAPTAFVATVLSGFGADVVRVDRAATAAGASGPNPLNRGRRSVAIDLKSREGVETALLLAAHADVTVEGFRPGVAERLGIGPREALARNPRLVYGRLSGWGQSGEWAERTAHDLAVLALTGALERDPETGAPVLPPSAYLSSFAGGGMAHVQALLAALYERSVSGQGQVVDTALSDGAALVTTLVHQWRAAPGVPTVTDAPHYAVYTCADGRHMAVAAIEPRLYQALLLQLDLHDAPDLADRDDPEQWDLLRSQIAARFRLHDSDHWAKVFSAVDAGTVPVLSADEAARHPQLAARAAFLELDGARQVAPASRFGRTPAAAPGPSPVPGEQTAAVLADWVRQPERRTTPEA
ncbi:CaiB/BaiF CoA-transferase family protein [Streptomyces sp. NPDC005892]|uniref:CaiB/BaiF CoA transferase family protein n=1 Tax=Streptomyces sp. NPDC005892 TaxID=3155593 RepID=UPI0033D10FAB